LFAPRLQIKATAAAAHTAQLKITGAAVVALDRFVDAIAPAVFAVVIDRAIIKIDADEFAAVSAAAWLITRIGAADAGHYHHAAKQGRSDHLACNELCHFALLFVLHQVVSKTHQPALGGAWNAQSGFCNVAPKTISIASGPRSLLIAFGRDFRSKEASHLFKGAFMANGHDEACASDLGNVIEGRALSRDEAGWLARAVTGAIRPNRDKPLWDLAHALVLLGQQRIKAAVDARGVFDLVLDPRLARSDVLHQQLAAVLMPAALDQRGIVFNGLATPWQMGWGGLARLMALAEFILTMDALGSFRDITEWLDEALTARSTAEGIELLVKRLTRQLNLYRQAHVPLAPVEKRFRTILSFLGARRGAARLNQFDDADIAECWASEIGQGERPLFRTVAEHFVTYEKLSAVMGSLRGVSEAVSVESIEDWADRLDAMLGDVAMPEEAEFTLSQQLAALPDTPKILTGAERDDLADLIALAPFHGSRPLTVLRSVSFGRVQSGIGNFLRRGSGGFPVEERVTCREAETYEEIIARAEALRQHLGRMVKIAAALRLSGQNFDQPEITAMLAAAENDIKRVRRAGFDDRETLKAAFARIDETLLSVSAEIGRFLVAVAKPSGGALPQIHFEQDRDFFSGCLKAAYMTHETATSGANV
jgi:hypothetical protein